MRAAQALAAAALALACGPAAGSAAAAPRPPLPVVGIADQKPDMFGDPRFTLLGISRARLSVAWDAMSSPWQVAELDRWMWAARGAGVRPLVTFAPSRLPGQRRAWPSAAQLVAALRALRARYPWLKEFSTWNEANFCGFGPCRDPRRVARWWRALTAACRSCTVLGADLLDLPSTPVFVRRFVRAARRAPRAWGYHNYLTANRFDVSRTRTLLRATRGELWLTETGGLVARRNASPFSAPEGVAHAARVTRFILRRLAALSPRVTRVYLYHWDSASPLDSWDSAFVGPDGRERPALALLRQMLGIRHFWWFNGFGRAAPRAPRPAR